MKDRTWMLADDELRAMRAELLAKGELSKDDAKRLAEIERGLKKRRDVK